MKNRKIHRKNYVLAFLIGLWFTLALGIVVGQKFSMDRQQDSMMPAPEMKAAEQGRMEDKEEVMAPEPATDAMPIPDEAPDQNTMDEPAELMN